MKKNVKLFNEPQFIRVSVNWVWDGSTFRLSVGLHDLMAVDRLLDLFSHRFLCFSSIFFCFSYSYVRQTKLASSLVNFWAHNKIVYGLIYW